MKGQPVEYVSKVKNVNEIYSYNKKYNNYFAFYRGVLVLDQST